MRTPAWSPDGRSPMICLGDERSAVTSATRQNLLHGVRNSGRPRRLLRRPTPTTSQFDFQHLSSCLHAAGGDFNVSLPPPSSAAKRQ